MKDKIEQILLETKREGMPELLGFMDKAGFYTVPCSGGYHLCKEGGLAEHSYNVFEVAHKLADALYDQLTDEIRNSITIAALLHDLGKIGDYGKPLYVDNVLKSGKVSDSKPYKRNTELSNVPHAIRSVKLAGQYIKLTEDEEWAILTHDGLYDFMKYEIPSHETKLSLILHWADMWACRIIEDSTDSID